MTQIFLQKIFIEGTENIYECSIDKFDYVHFIHGKSNGSSSTMETSIDEVNGEFIIDFRNLRKFIEKINKSFNYQYETKVMEFEYIINDIEDNLEIKETIKSPIGNTNIEIIISKKFLIESYEILETLWIED